MRYGRRCQRRGWRRSVYWRRSQRRMLNQDPAYRRTPGLTTHVRIGLPLTTPCWVGEVRQGCRQRRRTHHQETVRSEGLQGRRDEKHDDPAWGAYRVLYGMSQTMCPALQETLFHRGRSTKLPREKGHMQSMPSGRRGCKGGGQG